MRAVLNKGLHFICYEGRFETLADKVRHRGPWQALSRAETLRSESRLALSLHSFIIVEVGCGILACRSLVAVVKQFPSVAVRCPPACRLDLQPITGRSRSVGRFPPLRDDALKVHFPTRLQQRQGITEIT